ncbi:MAG: cupin domain-containing protein [Bacteroidales bacterium]|nr:cupin domain-containing protein [Bacteroidales bacterium]MCF8388969.1 cupin domain-containing protein [Bacteroidales bacterium]
MPKIINIHTANFERNPKAPEDFQLLTLMPRISKAAQSKHLVFDVRKLEPGRYSFPYHFHHHAEELMYLISGAMMMRSPDGFKALKQGDLVYFEMGPEGAHQFYNQGKTVCVYLDIRTSFGVDVSEYPDSGKINLLPYQEVYEKKSKVGYFKGEEKISDIWNTLRENDDRH